MSAAVRYRYTSASLVSGTIGTLLWCLIAIAAPASAADRDDTQRSCTRCHAESGEHSVLDIQHTKHAVAADSRTPFATDQACVACHGASIDHQRRPRSDSQRAPADLIFGSHPNSSPSSEQNAACLGCHQNGARLHWQGSTHEAQGLNCSSCHTTHSASDPALDSISESELCFGCHQQQRAELHRPSSHPLLDGVMGCSDCHNTHGSSGDSLLTERTTNQTCYACHAEMRGPFLWEHSPVREDCGICHRPHGSVQQSLLTARPPWLCQQCHLAQRHPSTAYSGTGLGGETTPSGAQSLLGKNCMNCHPQVHGSNHPSGARITR